MVSAEAEDVRAGSGQAAPWERRLSAEWELLGRLMLRNPTRLGQVHTDDRTFRFTLEATPAPALQPGAEPSGGPVRSSHRVRVEYARFFPATPMEVYLDEPVFHPNVHPETGFVCVWDRHLVANSIEHAIHKTVAILGWRLANSEAHHVMQPMAQAISPRQRRELAERLQAPLLLGVERPAETLLTETLSTETRRMLPRRRLSCS